VTRSARDAIGAVTSSASVTVSLTGLHACSWQITNFASAVIVFLPASDADTGMSKRALSVELDARSPRDSFGLGTVTPAAAVSARLIGASALRCQPPLAFIVSVAVAVPPTASLGSVFVTS
jgi:hypothetical protein